MLFGCVLGRQGVVRRRVQQQGRRSWDVLTRPAAPRGTGQPARRACSFSGGGPDNNKAVEVECMAIRLVICVRVETHFPKDLTRQCAKESACSRAGEVTRRQAVGGGSALILSLIHI